MNTSAWFETHMIGSPIMAILRGHSVSKSRELAAQAWELGIAHVEIPVQNEQGLEALSAVAADGHARGAFVGAGTVDTVDKVREAVNAGADYTVAPGLDAEVVAASKTFGLPHLPGIATATEIHRARALGLSWMKAFPAESLGPSWFRTITGPFPDIRFVATGGLNADNAQSFLTAGARVAAVGSALADPSQVTRLAALVFDHTKGSERC